MIELLNKLNNINFEELDIDEFLNKRDIEPFDSNWVRVYQIIEELKKGRTIDSTSCLLYTSQITPQQFSF